MSKPEMTPLDLLNKMRTMDYGKVLKLLTRIRDTDEASYRDIQTLVIKSQRKLPSLGQCHDCGMKFGDPSAKFPWSIGAEVVDLCINCNHKRVFL